MAVIFLGLIKERAAVSLGEAAAAATIASPHVSIIIGMVIAHYSSKNVNRVAHDVISGSKASVCNSSILLFIALSPPDSNRPPTVQCGIVGNYHPAKISARHAAMAAHVAMAESNVKNHQKHRARRKRALH